MYDANGNLLTIEDENGAYTLTYDALDRVETFEDMWGSLLTYSYDAVGNRTLVEDSEGGVQTSTYDAAHNLTKKEFNGTGLTPLRIDFTYNGNNQVESITRYSNLAGTTTVATTDYTYDGVGRVTNLHHEDSNPTNIANYTYVYDAVGNLVTEELNSSLTTYQYDDTNQLTDDGVNSHEYDANGNRIDGGYDVGPINQYTTDGTWDYIYDAAGNMTEKEDTVADIKWEYGYDHMNRLVWVEKIDTDTTDVLMRADYKYDALGNRIEKAVDADGDGGGGTDTTRYSYDGFKTNNLSYIGNENWDIWADLDGDNLNELEMRYIRGNAIDEIFAREDDIGSIAWYLTDHRGSVRHMTDNSGTVQNTIAYDGFGNITTETDPNFGDRYKWTSREYDVETKLQYNRARYYDADLGRWTSKDPLGFDAGDSNLYRYAHNRPTVNSDPSGLTDADIERIIAYVGRHLRKRPLENSGTPAERIMETFSVFSDERGTKAFTRKTLPGLPKSIVLQFLQAGKVGKLAKTIAEFMGNGETILKYFKDGPDEIDKAAGYVETKTIYVTMRARAGGGTNNPRSQLVVSLALAHKTGQYLVVFSGEISREADQRGRLTFCPPFEHSSLVVKGKYDTNTQRFVKGSITQRYFAGWPFGSPFPPK